MSRRGARYASEEGAVAGEEVRDEVSSAEESPNIVRMHCTDDCMREREVKLAGQPYINLRLTFHFRFFGLDWNGRHTLGHDFRSLAANKVRQRGSYMSSVEPLLCVRGSLYTGRAAPAQLEEPNRHATLVV